jgi:hypothetical protein
MRVIEREMRRNFKLVNSIVTPSGVSLTFS